MSSKEVSIAIPAPSDAALIRLASIAAQVEELLTPDNPLNKALVGIKTAKNDRRRAMEAVLVLLADAEVRNYLKELERLGLLPVKRAL
ncbi:MAG TPA: hypothetical protein VGU71_19405 [Candidatus Dormibacteraeota bacterium]|nr:hypothetical protein [Candidatus Dormibacteraeota bacterium]